MSCFKSQIACGQPQWSQRNVKNPAHTWLSILMVTYFAQTAAICVMAHLWRLRGSQIKTLQWYTGAFPPGGPVQAFNVWYWVAVGWFELACCEAHWLVLWWPPGAAGSVQHQGHECFCRGSRPGLWDQPILQQAVSLSLRVFFMSLSVPSFESWWPSIGTSSILTSPLQHRKLSWLQMYCQPDSSATRFIPSLTSAPLAAADKSSTWGVILLNETWTVLETL